MNWYYEVSRNLDKIPDSINYFDRGYNLFGYTNTLKMGWQISAVA